jgi:hypothetical protein
MADVATGLPAPSGNVTTAFTGAEPDNATAPTKDELSAREICERAYRRFEYEMEMDGTNRGNHVEDLRFAWERGAQWNEQIRKQRETAKPPRPWLEFNQTGQFVRQIVNDQRQNQPAIKVRPKGDGATKEVADIYSGIIRDIEYNSTAQAIYDSTLEQEVTGGIGYWRVITQYEKEDSFNQVLRLRPISDAMQVIVDSSAVQPDKSDIKYGFILEYLDQETFKEEWPDAAASISWDDSATDPYSSYFQNNKVCVADYYEICATNVDLLVLEDQRVMWEDDYNKMVKDLPQEMRDPVTGLIMQDAVPPPKILKRDPRKRNRVDWYKISALDKPLAKYEWLGKYIPILVAPGDEITINGKKVRQGIIRRLRDAQMMYNYWFTLATERIALAPKAPYTALDGQIENHPEWQTLNTENHPVLEYDPVQLADGSWYVTAPGRTESIQIDAGLVTMLQLCAQNLREITGMKDAALGQSNPEQPWRAILAEQRKGDNATFHYSDNLSRAICHGGRVLVDLIPKIMDVQRQVSTLAEDGTQKTVMVNQTSPDGTVENDLSQGEFDVVVDVGPSFATRRVEAASEMKEFMTAVGPEQAAVLGAIFAKAVDWPGDTGEKVSALLSAMLPQPLQDIINGDESQDPQVASLKAAMQQQQQQFQGMMTQVQQHIAELTQKNAELTLENMNDKLSFAAKMTEQITKRQNTEMTRAAESENSASQEFVAKLDGVSKMMDNFIKAMGMGQDPVALARAAVVIGPRVAGAVEHEVLLRVVGAGHPDRSAAAQVGVALRPCSGARILRSGDGVEAPRALAGLGIVGIDEPPNPVLGAGDAENDLVLDDERRDGGGVPELVIRKLDVVQDAAGSHVQRDEVRVDGGHEQAIAEDPEPAIHRAAAAPPVLRQIAAIAPDRAPRTRVDRPGVVVEPGDVQHAVDDHRRRLEAAERAGLERPLRRELADVLRRDLCERTVPLAAVVAAVGQPPRRILEAIQQVLRRHLRSSGLLRRQRGGRQDCD